MSKDRRLGRGLAALLGTPLDETGSGAADRAEQDLVDDLSEAVDVVSPGAPDTVQLNVYEIDDNPFQPRREFSEPEIASLSESLKEHDMLQPVLVRRVAGQVW